MSAKQAYVISYSRDRKGTSFMHGRAMALNLNTGCRLRSASRPGRFAIGTEPPITRTHWILNWVRPRAGLVALPKSLSPCREPNPSP